MTKKPVAKAHPAPIVTVADYINRIKNLKAIDDCFYTYRGEADIDWKRGPGIMRSGRDRLFEHERDATRDLVSVHPNEFQSDNTMFDRLVRMQHYGLPTRLMDVTGNPLVALFNATEQAYDAAGKPKDGRVYAFSIHRFFNKYYDSDTISCVANLANMSADERQELLDNSQLDVDDFNNPKKVPASDRLLQFIRAEKPSFRPLIRGFELDMVWYVNPKLSNRRIIAQNGAFIIFGLSLNPKKKTADMKKINLHSIVIPEANKLVIRDELKLLGITESSLFPEIDKAAKFIRQRYGDV